MIVDTRHLGARVGDPVPEMCQDCLAAAVDDDTPVTGTSRAGTGPASPRGELLPGSALLPRPGGR